MIQNHLSRIQIPIKYDIEAKCPQFVAYLASSLDNDEKKITMVQRHDSTLFNQR